MRLIWLSVERGTITTSINLRHWAWVRSTFLNIDLVLFSQYYGVSLLSARSCQSVIFVRHGKLEAWCAKKKKYSDDGDYCRQRDKATKWERDKWLAQRWKKPGTKRTPKNCKINPRHSLWFSYYWQYLRNVLRFGTPLHCQTLDNFVVVVVVVKKERVLLNVSRLKTNREILFGHPARQERNQFIFPAWRVSNKTTHML